MERKYSKAVNKKLLQLAGLAHEREQENHLIKLAGKFDAWRNKEIDCWDLTDAIHDFHQKDARGVYKIYTGKRYDVQVARALSLGILKKQEVGDELFAAIEDLMSLFEERGS